jgi:hypothetical protein
LAEELEKLTEKTARLPVTFNDSASGSLRLALAEAGRNDHVITFLDDFSFGPINPDDPETRARWVETELNICGERFRGRSDEVVTLALSTAEPPIAWISPESAGTMAAFDVNDELEEVKIAFCADTHHPTMAASQGFVSA